MRTVTFVCPDSVRLMTGHAFDWAAATVRDNSTWQQLPLRPFLLSAYPAPYAADAHVSVIAAQAAAAVAAAQVAECAAPGARHDAVDADAHRPHPHHQTAPQRAAQQPHHQHVQQRAHQQQHARAQRRHRRVAQARKCDQLHQHHVRRLYGGVVVREVVVQVGLVHVRRQAPPAAAADAAAPAFARHNKYGPFRSMGW